MNFLYLFQKLIPKLNAKVPVVSKLGPHLEAFTLTGR